MGLLVFCCDITSDNIFVMILSVHIPKCAGSSFEGALRSRFRVLRDLTAPRDTMDYEGAMLEVPKNIQLVHGHFPATKYLNRFPDADIITWVRDPWERFVSHVNYEIQEDGKPVNWRKKLYDRYKINFINMFFDGVPIERFKFIGIVEDSKGSMERFNETFNVDCRLPILNTTKSKEYPGEDLHREFERLNERDRVLYNRVVEKMA